MSGQVGGEVSEWVTLWMSEQVGGWVDREVDS